MLLIDRLITAVSFKYFQSRLLKLLACCY